MAEDVFKLVGTVVAGVFQVEDVVAEGGFGVVYRAHHIGFNAKVALKCLKIPQHMTEERRARFKAQFRAEAQLLFKLSASIPSVVRPLHIDAITAPNERFMPFMALEWLEGETLEGMVLRREQLGLGLISLAELVELLTPAARALEQAHHFPSEDGPVSIVHRDIKPENLFLAEVAGKRAIKILDFGIGKARSAATQAVGKASADAAFTSFTPAFGAPEQWVPKRFGQTGPWTDVWGMALTAVEVLVGRPILDGDQAAMMGAVLDPSRRPTPRSEGLDVSAEVEAVFRKALAIDPRDRYQDAGAFWDALTAAMDDCAPLVSDPGYKATVAMDPHDGSQRHGELDLGEAGPSLSLELASVPPSASAETRYELGRGGAPQEVSQVPRTGGSLRPRFSDIPLQLPPVSVRPRRALWIACLVPATAVLAGIALAALGQYYAATSGKVFSIGPLRLGWLTVPLVLAGSAALIARFMPRGGPVEP
jgi:serine/threonine-protein kinase